jgi:tRNA (guanine-N7-)-methyltransferase
LPPAKLKPGTQWTVWIAHQECASGMIARRKPEAGNIPPVNNPIDTQRIRRRIRSFVVRAGRMTAGQERAWRDLWPLYGIHFKQVPLDLDAIFGRQAPRVLEIGFGTGDALHAYAQLHPDHDCLGIEVHPPGVGHLMIRSAETAATNIRILCHDAVEVLTLGIADRSFDEVHLFFPDPWHKKRHHKRRLVQPEFVDLLARVLKPGGILKMATDWQHYAEQMLTVLAAHPAFENAADPDSACGFATRAEHRPLTRFERRGHRLGHLVWDLTHRRV